MKLPFNLFKNKSEEKLEYYLALLLTDEKASAVILKEHLGKLQVIGKHEEHFSTFLDAIEFEEFISVIDKTISRAEEVLPPEIETHKTVFGLKESWVDSEAKKIKKEYLAKLKKMCDALDLSPMGFMVVTEAISNLLQEEEGAPLSAILAEVGSKKVNLTLFRGGKVVEKVDGPIENSEAETVDNLLKHFSATVLPARIILYDVKDSDKLSQTFINHQWSKSLPFLHVPQVVSLPEGADARAVVFGAAEQMGFEVMDVGLKMVGTKGLEEIEETHSASSGQAKEIEDAEGKEIEHISSDNFGFVKDQDIVSVNPPKKKMDDEELSVESDFQKEDQEMEEETIEKKGTGSKISSILNIFSSISLPKISASFIKGKNKYKLLIAIAVAIVLLIFGVMYFYSSSVKATIVLSVKPKMVDETATVIFSSTSPSDFSQNIIATKTVETAVVGDITIDTTGKKDVGNKAKGKVTIYNNGNDTAKLHNGDSIKSSNGLIFLLDKDVTISSASGDIFSGTKPGTTDVDVNAKEIGTEYNLPSGTKFTVGNSSSLAAKNDSAFSGGTKKQVQVVSKDDVAKLREDLPKSLESKAHKEISGKASGGEKVLPLVLVDGLDDEAFDKKVDDEAKKVKLTAKVNFFGMAYQEDDLTDYAKSLLKNKYTQEISFANESIKIEVKDAKEKKDNQIEAELVLSGGLLPDINIDEIKQKAKNQSISEIKEMLKNQPQVVSTQINFSPSLLFLPNLFSKLPSQISVEIKPE